jgi:hypothetical protein
METFDFPSTNSTPHVKYGADRKLIIKGRSISENEITFYKPIIAWAGLLQQKTLIVDINLEYVNSQSSKSLFQLFKVLDQNRDIANLIINWYYDEGDDDALIKGQVFQDLLKKAEFRFHNNPSHGDPT